jgi:hypothetical protein
VLQVAATATNKHGRLKEKGVVELNSSLGTQGIQGTPVLATFTLDPSTSRGKAGDDFLGSVSV